MTVNTRVPLLGQHKPPKRDAFAHIDTTHFNQRAWQVVRLPKPKAVAMARSKFRAEHGPVVKGEALDVDTLLAGFEYETAEAKVDRLRSKLGGWSGPRIEKASAVPEVSVLQTAVDGSLLRTDRVQDDIRALRLGKVAQGERKFTPDKPDQARQSLTEPALLAIRASRTAWQASELVRLAALDYTRLLDGPRAREYAFTWEGSTLSITPK